MTIPGVIDRSYRDHGIYNLRAVVFAWNVPEVRIAKELEGFLDGQGRFNTSVLASQ